MPLINTAFLQINYVRASIIKTATLLMLFGWLSKQAGAIFTSLLRRLKHWHLHALQRD